MCGGGRGPHRPGSKWRLWHRSRRGPRQPVRRPRRRVAPTRAGDPGRHGGDGSTGGLQTSTGRLQTWWGTSPVSAAPQRSRRVGARWPSGPQASRPAGDRPIVLPRGVRVNDPSEPGACRVLSRPGPAKCGQLRSSSAMRNARSSDWRRVEPGVAGRRVALAELALDDVLDPAQAFGDVVAGQLDVHPAGPGSGLAVDARRSPELADDVVEAPGLAAALGGEGVAVHRVAHPHAPDGPASSTARSSGGRRVLDRRRRRTG